MKIIKISILLLLFLFNFNILPQSINSEINNINEKKINIYAKLGVGKLNDYLNFGAGIFFPLARNIMLGFRGNANNEIDTFKTPSENLTDINLSLRYIPYWDKNFIIMAGGRLGYAVGEKRGSLIGQPLSVPHVLDRILREFNVVLFI